MLRISVLSNMFSNITIIYNYYVLRIGVRRWRHEFKLAKKFESLLFFKAGGFTRSQIAVPGGLKLQAELRRHCKAGVVDRWIQIDLFAETAFLPRDAANFRGLVQQNMRLVLNVFYVYSSYLYVKYICY